MEFEIYKDDSTVIRSSWDLIGQVNRMSLDRFIRSVNGQFYYQTNLVQLIQHFFFFRIVRITFCTASVVKSQTLVINSNRKPIKSYFDSNSVVNQRGGSRVSFSFFVTSLCDNNRMNNIHKHVLVVSTRYNANEAAELCENARIFFKYPTNLSLSSKPKKNQHQKKREPFEINLVIAR